MKKLLLAMTMAACGGSSSGGIDRSELVVDMTPGEVTDECTFLYDNYPQKTDDCGNGDTSTVGEPSIAECENNLDDTIDGAPNCTVTIGEAEDCIADLYDATACASSLPASCAPLFSSDCAVASSRKLVERAIGRPLTYDRR